MDPAERMTSEDAVRVVRGPDGKCSVNENLIGWRWCELTLSTLSNLHSGERQIFGLKQPHDLSMDKYVQVGP